MGMKLKKSNKKKGSKDGAYALSSRYFSGTGSTDIMSGYTMEPAKVKSKKKTLKTSKKKQACT